MSANRIKLALAALVALLAVGAFAPAAGAATTVPTLVRDVKTGKWRFGTRKPEPSDIQEYVQPDTQIEPSVAVNPANPQNVVAAYQEGRVADGGDATNGYATSFDGGKTWSFGELPGLTTFPGQGGEFERASDAVVAFGPNNVVYANSLIFDFNPNFGLRSAIAVNVSKDGGKTWSKPAVFQDDLIGGLNDKNWIVVDNSNAPGHHKGRVYVVWDRVAPLVYNYCDQDCENESNWLPNFKTIPGLVFGGQAIGAYPMILNSGGLGIVVDTANAGFPTQVVNGDEPETEPSGAHHVFFSAPAAGSTPYPAPLAFVGPNEIAANLSNGVATQRASDGLPAAAVDPKTGYLYTVWDDGRLRSDSQNDAVISRSTDEGTSWSKPQRLNGGGEGDHIDHYNVTVAADNGVVHVAWRQRDESAKGPLYAPVIDTYYRESRDNGKTWTPPLQVNTVASNPFYGAFSRNGTFEGDYNQTASSGGYTYITRAQGQPTTASEPRALVPNPDGSNTIVLTNAGKGHQHQSNWVALVRDLPPAASAPPQKLPKRCTDRRKFTFHLHHNSGSRVVRVEVFVNGKRRLKRSKHSITKVTIGKLPKKKTFTVKIVATQSNGAISISTRKYRGCRKSRPHTKGKHPKHHK